MQNEEILRERKDESLQDYDCNFLCRVNNQLVKNQISIEIKS